jgi:iron transport multicopper oxidase
LPREDDWLTSVKDLFDNIPNDLSSNVTGWFVLDSTRELPIPAELHAFEPLDDFLLQPLDSLAALDTVDRTITLDIKMDNLGDGAN